MNASNKIITFMMSSSLFFIIADAKPSKIVGLLAVRNERIFIEQCLRALSLYTDAIVVLDDASTDDTVAIIESLAQECKVQKIIRKKTWFRDEPADQNKLLAGGREVGGTHFIHLDADEMFTSNCLDSNFLRKRILALVPGERINLNWIQLWRSVNQYRFDQSVWTWNYKDFIFCDDGKCGYTSGFIHTQRTPNNLHGKVYTIEGYTYGVLHFQFVCWRNLLIKQAWYRCLEKIRLPERSDEYINTIYSASKNEKNLGTQPTPSEWFSNYVFFNSNTCNQPEQWRERQVLEWFQQYGRNHFAGLDIWDIDWGSGLH